MYSMICSCKLGVNILAPGTRGEVIILGVYCAGGWVGGCGFFFFFFFQCVGGVLVWVVVTDLIMITSIWMLVFQYYAGIPILPYI